MQRDRLNIGTTLRVASLALAIGLLASPAAAQTYGDWNARNGSGGGAGGESGSGAATERVMPYERNTSGGTLTGRAYRGYDGRQDGNTGRAYRSYDDVDGWNGGYTR